MCSPLAITRFGAFASLASQNLFPVLGQFCWWVLEEGLEAGWVVVEEVVDDG
jgi:hypothetical protein